MLIAPCVDACPLWLAESTTVTTLALNVNLTRQRKGTRPFGGCTGIDTWERPLRELAWNGVRIPAPPPLNLDEHFPQIGLDF